MSHGRALPIVAIDGPAGAGKSTIARKLAEALGYLLVDTGAMYRAVALAAQRRSIAWEDGPAVGALARELADGGHIVLARGDDGDVRVVLEEEDVTREVRTPELGRGASIVSVHPAVREVLVDLQRRAGQGGGVVLEGRDIGTVVFPDADVKFFLTAAPAVRAQRRFEELMARGSPTTLEATLAEVIARDEQDMSRATSPLRKAEDAHEVDSSTREPDEIVAAMLDLVRRTRGVGS